jgi:YD repeat-containing protein
LGYQIKYLYSTTLANGALDDGNHTRIAQVIAINKEFEACNPAGNACSLTYNWQNVSFEYGNSTNDGRWIRFVDKLGQKTFYDYKRVSGGLRLHRVQLPLTSTGYDVTYTYWSSGRVREVNGDPGLWKYSYSGQGTGTVTTSITDPDNRIWTVISRESDGQVTREQNPIGQRTDYTYLSNGLLQKIRAPEGNEVRYTYDARGNVTRVTRASKTGTQLLETNYAYPSCTTSNRKTCNKPSSVTDSQGVTTSFTYSTGHGGVLTVSSPVTGTSTTAWGNYTASYVDHTGAAASGSAHRPMHVDAPTGARTTFEYNGHRNIQVFRVTVSGTGITTAVTTLGHDRFGNVTSVTDPAGAVVRSNYDMLRRPVTQIGPKPTGSSLQYSAAKTL